MNARTELEGNSPRAGVYYPGIHGRGGAERLCLALACVLAEIGWRTTVFTDVDVDRAQVEHDFGASLQHVDFVRLPPPPSTRWLKGEPKRLLLLLNRKRALRRHKLDVFVNAKYKSQVPGCGRTNIYYTHFPHRTGPQARGVAHRVYLAVAAWLERTAIHRSKRGFIGTYQQVWANSAFTAGHVADRWRTTAQVVYPPCPDVPALPKEKVIAVVSRFQTPQLDVPHKAQDVLVDVFSTLGDLHAAGWRLVLAGGTSPEHYGYVESLRQQARDLPVVFQPDASRAEIEELLGRASLYWHAQGILGGADSHPETQEHFGISVVEAMSAEALPLVYGGAGPAEIVAGAEGLTPWQTAEELADMTRVLAHAPEDKLADVRKAARARSLRFGDREFAETVRGLLNGRTPRG